MRIGGVVGGVVGGGGGVVPDVLERGEGWTHAAAEHGSYE